jgi:transcriptional regulator with XRE-family HTH domain
LTDGHGGCKIALVHAKLAPALTGSNVPPLRQVRIARGYGLRETAQRAGIDPAHLSRVERGERQLSVDALGRLAEVLGLTELAKLLAPYRGAA